MRKKALITGSSGMLGKDVVNVLSLNKELDLFGADLKKSDLLRIEQFELDLLDREAVAGTLKKIGPAVIVHCAANVNVDDCEKNHERTYALHVDATRSLAEYDPGNTRFIYISTDAVYGSGNGDHVETEQGNPANYYAQTKYEGERAALSANPAAIVLRTNIYGYNVPLKGSLAEWALKNWEQNKAVNGFNDVIFNPLYTKQLSRIISSLIKVPECAGIMNAGSANKVSKFDFLAELAGVFGYPVSMVNGISVDSVKFIAPRTKNSTMNTDKLMSLLGNVPDLKSGINELKNDMKISFPERKLA